MKDNRICKRFPLFSQVVYCSLTERGCVNVNVHDLSSDGIGISSEHKLDKGDTVELEIKVSGDDIPMFVTGEVAWVKKGHDKAHYRAGIKLNKIERIDKVRLIKFMDKGFPNNQ